MENKAPVKYVMLCKASSEYFTFDSMKSLMDYVNGEELGEPQFPDLYESTRVFEIVKELSIIPQEEVLQPMVKSWMLREKR